MIGSIKSKGPAGVGICLSCGLCCNGVIFAGVELQPGDDARRLRALGLAVEQSDRSRRKARFAQPCQAFDGCRCKIYDGRPVYCRAFECALLKEVQNGGLKAGAALKTVRIAKAHAENVRKLLRALGDTEERLALSKRFQRTRRRVERTGLEPKTAALFADLTLAMHALNRLVAESFYPGKRQDAASRAK